MTEFRALAIGLALGAGVAGVLCWMLMEPSAMPVGYRPAEAAAGPARPAADAGRTDLEAELARLQAELDALRSERGELKEAALAAPDAVTAEEVAQGVGEAQPLNAAALLAELNEEFVRDALIPSMQSRPGALYDFILGTWLRAQRPDRALDLFLRFELGPDGGGWAARIAAALRKAGDDSGAALASARAVQSGLIDDDAVRSLLEVAPRRALELLQQGEFPMADQDELKSFVGAAQLRTGDLDGALATLDPLIQSNDLDRQVWNMFIDQAPDAAIERLQRKLDESSGRQSKGYELMLARALGAAGNRDEAINTVEAVLEREQLDSSAIQALARIDQSRALAWLEGVTRRSPSDSAFGYYATQLEAAGRKQEAIGALTQAIELDPSEDKWTRRLLRLSPQIGAARLTGMARRKRDDELLGDIGDQLWRLGQHQQAEAMWREASAIDPGDGEWTSNLFAISRGWDPLQ